MFSAIYHFFVPYKKIPMFNGWNFMGVMKAFRQVFPELKYPEFRMFYNLKGKSGCVICFQVENRSIIFTFNRKKRMSDWGYGEVDKSNPRFTSIAPGFSQDPWDGDRNNLLDCAINHLLTGEGTLTANGKNYKIRTPPFVKKEM